MKELYRVFLLVIPLFDLYIQFQSAEILEARAREKRAIERQRLQDELSERAWQRHAGKYMDRFSSQMQWTITLLVGVYMLFIYQMLSFLKLTRPYISAIFAVLALFCIILIVTMIIIYGGIQPDGKFPRIIHTIFKTIYGIMLLQY